jgi:hypothetical protein
MVIRIICHIADDLPDPKARPSFLDLSDGIEDLLNLGVKLSGRGHSFIFLPGMGLVYA